MNLDATRKRRNAGSRTVITMIMIIGVAVNKLEVFGSFSTAAVGDLSFVYRASGIFVYGGLCIERCSSRAFHD